MWMEPRHGTGSIKLSVTGPGKVTKAVACSSVFEACESWMMLVQGPLGGVVSTEGANPHSALCV
jgi:hypothetical protein